jgi:archaellum component FlaC
MADETSKSPAELRKERLDQLRSQWNDLSDRTSLGHLYDRIEDIDGEIESIPQRVEDLRRRGYVYTRPWESQASTIKDAWPDRRREAQRILRARTRDIKDMVEEVDDLATQGRLTNSALDRLESVIERVESRIDGADNDVSGAYDTLTSQLSTLEAEMRRAERAVEEVESASFKLYPEEHVVATSDAIWTSDHQEPQGKLFLTSGRLIFEQREKKALKKVLFITTKSEMVQEVLWECPVGAVTEFETKDERGGFLGLGGKEMLTLRFSERTRDLPSDVTLRLKGSTNEQWQSLIDRVRDGEIVQDRYDYAEPEGAEAQTAAPPEQEKEIPTVCPNCNAQLPPAFKGMQELTCEYCGTTVRL